MKVDSSQFFIIKVLSNQVIGIRAPGDPATSPDLKQSRHYSPSENELNLHIRYEGFVHVFYVRCSTII